jgi:apolipoprotein N-acyltransferase
VETGRWYVRAGHDSPSFIIDHRGSVVAQQDWFMYEPLVVSVPILQHHTVYSQIRLGVLAVMLGLVILFCWQPKSVRIRSKTTR